MAHNFQKTGTYYVSKAGSDSNSGTSPDAPKLTPQAAINAAATDNTLRTIVIGSGYYTGSLTIGNRNVMLVADGIVIVDLNLGNYTTNSNGGATSGGANGVWFINGSVVSAVSSGGSSFTNCIFETNFVTNNTFIYSFISSLLINISIVGTNRNFNLCTLINVNHTTAGIGSFTNSIANSGCLLSVTTSTAANFNYNCLNNCAIRMNYASTVTSGIIQDNIGNYYDLSIAGTGGSGTIGDPYWRGNTQNTSFLLTAHKVAYPTLNVNSFNSDPLFNNASIGDFTLQPTSPCYKTGSSGATIGDLGIAKAKYVGVDYTPVVTNCVGTTDITVNGSGTGIIETPWIQYNSYSIEAMGELKYTGRLKFDKSETLGTSKNTNVPDAVIYSNDTSTQGGNPDRLVIELAWYTGGATPTVLADADNGGLAAAGTWTKFQLGLPPTFSAVTGVSNADPTWNRLDTQLVVGCTWYKARITLNN